MEYVLTLRTILWKTTTVSAYEWLDVETCQKAERMHDGGAALAICKLKSVLEELDRGSDREADLLRFLVGLVFGLPHEARRYYGTFGVKEYGEWCMGFYALDNILIGSQVLVPGDYIFDEEIKNRVKRLLDSGAICHEKDVWKYVDGGVPPEEETPPEPQPQVIETAEALPLKEETEVKQTKKKRRGKSAE